MRLWAIIPPKKAEIGLSISKIINRLSLYPTSLVLDRKYGDSGVSISRPGSRLASNPNYLWAPFRNRNKFINIMGDYKGRRNLRQRKKRFAKERRIRALSATEKRTAPLPTPGLSGK